MPSAGPVHGTGKLFFVGGVSGAGKTTYAKRLAALFKVPLINLDHLHKPVEHLRLSGLISKEFSFELGRQISSTVLANLIASGTECIVEGVWIDVAQAARWDHNPNFHPAFLGIPAAMPEVQLEVLRSRNHWIADRERTEALQILQQHIGHSAVLARECEQFGIPFFDFSDFETGSSAATKHFLDIGAIPARRRAD